jgi:ABC-type enterochelin transport system ATPase subunit
MNLNLHKKCTKKQYKQNINQINSINIVVIFLDEVKAMSAVKVMCQVKKREHILADQLHLLFDECEQLMKAMNQAIGKNKEKLTSSKS